MRVLVACVSQTGHLAPVLPLAEAFAARGDDVIVASAPEAAGVVARHGLEFRAVGPDFGDWFAELGRRMRGQPGDGIPAERVLGYWVPRLFGEVGVSLVVDDLLAVAREFGPDLLVFETCSFAGPLVAALTGAHPVHHTLGPLVVDPAVLDLVTDAVSPIWREFGLDAPAAAGIFSGPTVHLLPAALGPNPEGVVDSLFLRPSALPMAAAPALPVTFADPSRALVYVTLGTLQNTDLDLFRLILAALADEPVNVLVTVGRENDPALLGPIPANARVERFIPQAEVLPHCAAVIHHAGAGTMFGVLSHGLPSVALPQGADNFTNAHLMAEAGTAVLLMPGQVCAEAITAGLRAVVGSGDYRQRAVLVAAEMRAMPTPAEVAEMLATRFGDEP